MVTKKRSSQPRKQPASGVGGHLCLDFVNTAQGVGFHRRPDRLETYSDLVRLGRASGVLDQKQESHLLASAAQDQEGALAALHESKRARDNLKWLLQSVTSGALPAMADLEEFNQRLSDALRHCAIRYKNTTLVWEIQGLGLVLVSPLWSILKDAAELVTSSRVSRVKMCRNENCGQFFLDTTKNGTRQWCEMRTCGNRAKAQRHRQRAKNNS